jgi:DNA (cytosine-5)-methyltransferase 1
VRAIDLCAGAGLLSFAMKEAGFDVLGVEKDADAADTHNRHAGPCDVADITVWSPPWSARLVAGGEPCQSFSSSGKRLGIEDERGRLYLDHVRIALEAKADAILLENVPGILTWRRNDGWTAARIVADAFERAGFETRFQVLDAAHFGVPQHRKRVFFVGFRHAWMARKFRWPEATHGKPGNMFLPPYKTVREALALEGDFARIPYERGITGQGQRVIDVDRPSHTIGCSRNADLIARLVEAGLYDRPGTTIAASQGTMAKAGHHRQHQEGAVRLTPAQCAAIQDFPPEWTFTGNISSQYRQIGNAVPRGLAVKVCRAVRLAMSE